MIRFLKIRIGRKVAFSVMVAGVAAAVLGIYLSGESYDHRANWVLLVAMTAAVTATWLALHFFVLRPIEKLTQMVQGTEEGDYLKRIRIISDDEIGELAKQFNLMLARITDLVAERIDTEREKEQMQRELVLTEQLAEKTQALEVRVRDQLLLMDVTRAITSTIDLDEVLTKIADTVGGAMGFHEFAVLLFDEEKNSYQIVKAYGFPEEMDIIGLRFRKDEGAIALLHDTKETVLIEDTSNEPRYLHFKGARQDDGSLLAIPLIYHDDIVGAFSFTRPDKNAFELHEIWLLESIASQASLAIANASLHQQAVELSLTDALTGVANRRDLQRNLDMELPRAERFENPLSVIMIDIDHFKHFNDMHGHPIGDQVLITVAELLVECVRTVDTVARYGGEEFTVVLPSISKDRSIKVANKLRRAIGFHKFPGAENQPKGRLTLSLGVATFPDDATTVQGLLEKADIALYNAKKAGRDRTVGYCQELVEKQESNQQEDSSKIAV